MLTMKKELDLSSELMHDLSFLKYHQISLRDSLLIFEYLPWSLIVGRTFRIQSGFPQRHCHFNCVRNLNSLFNVMLVRLLPKPDIKNLTKVYILHGFQLTVNTVKDILKCRNCSQPRLVYTGYSLGGVGAKTLNKNLDNLRLNNEFYCGMILSTLFVKDSNLNTKKVTVDRRLACDQNVE